MLMHMDNSKLYFASRVEDVLYCPSCVSHLERNLRRDDHFVEDPYMGKYGHYTDFVNPYKGGKLVILELGPVLTPLPSSVARLNRSLLNIPKQHSSASISITLLSLL